MSEYDDNLYSQSLTYGSQINQAYKINPGVISARLQSRTKQVLGDQNPVRALVESGLILHVKVVSKTLEYDSLAYVPVEPLPMVCVQGQILDTIKGTRIPSGGEPPHNWIASIPTVKFSYSPLWTTDLQQRQLVDSIGYHSPQELVDPCTACYGTKAVQLNQEYVVFLRTVLLKSDSSGTSFEHWPLNTFEKRGGILPVTNGNVQDTENFWGMGTSVPVAIFKSGLEARINNLR